MDDQVLKAMARWPAVPAAFGWLRLDRRGGWHLVDLNKPGFDEARDGLGTPITSPQILEFIERNYGHDELGRWYWQNGPQRAFVDIEAAPLVLRVLGEGRDARFVTHTGRTIARVEQGWTGPHGEVLLETDQGPAVIHDLDLGALEIDEDGAGQLALQLGERRIELVATGDPARTLGFVARPRPD